MKCLSLKQPFADLLAHGEKTIELRKWNTSFRGEFLIHASKNIDKESCERLDMNSNKFVIGAIIGSAFLYNVKEYSNREEFERDRHKHFSLITKYFEGYRYGFLIRNAKMFKKPIPYPGKLKFFQVNDSILLN
ncbi:MAG TPA: ASCH domain-containing protein [Nitrososphaeraceae archaeon]|nr:ASCH domain-containing protein [Nitrososphaeraceae archaeon]